MSNPSEKPAGPATYRRTAAACSACSSSLPSMRRAGRRPPSMRSREAAETAGADLLFTLPAPAGDGLVAVVRINEDGSTSSCRCARRNRASPSRRKRTWRSPSSASPAPPPRCLSACPPTGTSANRSPLRAERTRQRARARAEPCRNRPHHDADEDVEHAPGSFVGEDRRQQRGAVAEPEEPGEGRCGGPDAEGETRAAGVAPRQAPDQNDRVEIDVRVQEGEGEAGGDRRAKPAGSLPAASSVSARAARRKLRTP